MEFLENCKAKDVIPHGLMLHKIANLDNCSDEFQNNWRTILNRASGELRDLVFRECCLTNETTLRNIVDMENCLFRDYGLQVCDMSNRKIMDICGKLKESLSIRRRTKLDKLCDINQSENQEEHLYKPPIRIREIRDGSLAPSSSQLDRFLTNVRSEVDNRRAEILFEDIGPEESLHGIKCASN